MSITKAQIANEIAQLNGFSKRQSDKIVDGVLELIKKTLESGDDVLISNFGKFCVKDKKARKGRNPATGQDMMLAPRRVVTFKSSGKLRDKINRVQQV